MELRHLQTFQAIVQEGSFLQAAEKLQYAQSTITLHIQQLEAQLGVQLFTRRGKKLELTTAGRALRGHADHLLHRATALQQVMLELVAGEAGHLRIGSIEPVASLRLSRLLVQFCREYPKVRLTLETGVTQVISQRVIEGELDIAICSPPASRIGLVFQQLFCDPMVLLIPTDHPLSRKAVIQVADLQSERLLLTERHCPYREVFEKAILAQGIAPYTGLEIMSLEALRRMVMEGLGLGVMPVDSVTPTPPGTVVRTIERLNLELPVGIAQFPEGSIPGLALDRLVQKLRNELGNLSLLPVQ
jgi:DNA-binding transcriptional LysR family regulator